MSDEELGPSKLVLLEENRKLIEKIIALEAEIKRLEEIEWMYNDLCK
jgi:hypothetical protein